MSNARDRLVSFGAGLLVIVLALLVVVAVLNAQNNGRDALESLQLSQVQQLARSLDAELAAVFGQAAGFGGTKPWDLTIGDLPDQLRLQALQAANPSAGTGYVLVDHTGMITNGTLLSQTSPGHIVDRAGLTTALAQGRPAVLPVGPGLTTPLPTAAVVFPVTDANHGPGGGLLVEVAVAPDSLFNQSVTALRRGRTVVYSFIDTNGVVVASSDTTSLGKKAPDEMQATRTGFRRHGSDVIVTEPVPTAGWRVAFKESSKEFEGALTGPLRSALLLIAVAALLAGGLTFFVLLSRLRAAREEQRRLRNINDAREEFISIVSHELRTPATGQLGFLETTLDHWDALDDSERKSALMHGLTNARRLHALTRDILSTASIEAGEMPYVFEPVDLRDAVSASADAVTSGPPVELHLPDQPCVVRGDPGRLHQVMTNLLDNAVKNSPTDLPIEVSLKTTPDGDALVEVHDSGTGMTDEQARRAFEKFARGRNTGVEGTGLGLYISQRIVQAHDGRIWIAIDESPGTTVAFTLPLLSSEPAPPPPPAPTSAEKAATGG
jgi:signal transduction histidine kinase